MRFLQILILIVLPVDILTNYLIVCYYTNWSQYRAPKASFMPENIDPNLCTHIVYAFARINPITFKIELSEWNDEEMIRKVNDLKISNPKLKTLLGIGGWNHERDQSPFSLMTATADNRKIFIDNAVSILQERSFDGLDLDWEYPGRRDHGHPDDKDRFSALCKELYEAFQNDSIVNNKDRFILASSVSVSLIDTSYDVTALATYLDFVSLLSYDLYGNWNNFTAHHTTMDTLTEFNVPKSVDEWINRGMPNEKIVLGLATYGQTVNLVDRSQNGLFQGTNGSGTKGNYTNQNGILSLYEICNENWDNTVNDEAVKAPYSYKDNQWVSYDDQRSVTVKVDTLVVPKNLLGVMIWTLDFDDFDGIFCNSGKYPLVHAAKDALEKHYGTTSRPETTSTSTSTSTVTTTDTTISATTSISSTEVTTEKTSTTTKESTVVTMVTNMTTVSSTTLPTTTSTSTTTTYKPITTTKSPTTGSSEVSTKPTTSTTTTQKPITATKSPTTASSEMSTKPTTSTTTTAASTTNQASIDDSSNSTLKQYNFYLIVILLLLSTKFNVFQHNI